jgi:hypothetical protein
MSEETEKFYRFKIREASGADLKTYRSLLAGEKAGDPFCFEETLPIQIVRHCLDQIEEAGKNNDPRQCWRDLFEILGRAADYHEGRNFARSCEAFFLLGQLSGELSMPSRQEYSEGMEAKLAKMKRELPLVKKNIAATTVREIAQEVAKLEWEADTDQSLRLSDMCEVIWAKLMSVHMSADLIDALPDQASGLKVWLRPVAPEYAKKGGRPRKK